MPRKKAVQIKKYKSIQTATTGRRVTGSLASRKVSTAVSRESKKTGGTVSLPSTITKTISGLKTPIKKSTMKRKNK
jgi:hypothetical protein